MRGRKPIGQVAMTNAERQRRWRQRHRAKTPSEKFRRKLYWLIRWFSHWLSADEIKETFEAFGMAWAMHHYLVKEKGEPPEWMDWYSSSKTVPLPRRKRSHPGLVDEPRVPAAGLGHFVGLAAFFAFIDSRKR